MDLNLKDKIIIVTGGAKGIGLGVVEVLAAEGAIPVIVGRNSDDNEKVIEKLKAIGVDGFAITAELSDPKAPGQVIKNVVAQFGKIDGIVNNAGVNDGVGLEHGNYERFMQSIHCKYNFKNC
jgi:L-fucose dehydrogenase